MKPPAGGVALVPDHVQKVLKLVITLAIAAFGTVFCGMIVSVNLAGDGKGALAGCLVGFFLFACMGGFATGFWSDLVGSVFSSTREVFVPHSIATAFGAHGSFGLIVTVHRAQCQLRGQLPWQSRSLFAEVSCGQNPVKRTCVSGDGVFDETFKLQIRHADDTIFVQIKNQDIFGARDVGHVYVPIQSGILEQDFPRRAEYQIVAGDHEWLYQGYGSPSKLVLSFDRVPGQSDRSEQHALNPNTMKSHNYGAVAYLPDLEFNKTVGLPSKQAWDPYSSQS
mmetsp:Transcript_2699/g.7607  ORF Transcript_2699/g.7607 Transcript_2699/m.7607 type:complete len:280 (-) Transcript_2699:145-984(-)